MPRLLPRQTPPDRPALHLAYVPVCLACGERERFQVAIGQQIRPVSVYALEPGMRLVGCGRCQARHCIVMERAE